MDNRQAANLLTEIADLIGPRVDEDSTANQNCSQQEETQALSMVQEAQQLRRYAQVYATDQTNLLVVGAFNNGKSTLVNALLGVEAVQTGAVPTTAVFTHLRQGTSAMVVHPRLGSSYPLDPKEYWDQCDLSSETDWSNVDYLEITGQFDHLPIGVTLIDTPGLAEDHLRTALALEYLPYANAVIVILDAKQALTRAERNFIDLLGPGLLQNVFFVINRIDMLRPEEFPRLKDWLQIRLSQYFTDDKAHFSDNLYQRRVFFTCATAERNVSSEKAAAIAADNESVIALRQALMAWLEQHQQATTSTDLQLLIPVVADVLQIARQHLDFRQQALQQPLETLKAHFTESEERLQQVQQTKDILQARIVDAGNVMKHQIYSDLVNYIQSLETTWDTDIEQLDLAKLSNLNIFSAKFNDAEQAEVAQVMAQELQRYLQRKLVKWAQQLPTVLQESVNLLLTDIHDELRSFQGDLEDIALLMGQEPIRRATKRGAVGLLDLNETLYTEIFNNKTLLQMIHPMTDQVFAELSGNKTLMNVALTTLRAIFEAGSMFLFYGRGGQQLVGLFSRVGSELIQQMQYRRNHQELYGERNQSQRLDNAYGDLGSEKVEKLQRAVKASMAENLKSPLFKQMRDAILNKKEAIFQQIEAEFEKIGLAIVAKLDEAVEEVRTTQQQLIEIRETHQGIVKDIKTQYQDLEKAVRERLDQLCKAAISRTLSDDEIEKLSAQRNEFLTRSIPVSDEGIDLPIPDIPDTSVSSTTLPSSLSPNIFNIRLRWAMEEILGLEQENKDTSQLSGISTELAEMIGLDNVKQRILELMDYQAETQRRRQQGLSGGEPPSLHLVFTGNPGTGKTTVAEIVGKMYRRLGLLKRGHLISVGRSDLVGAYIGHSEKKVSEVVEKACDGVLFIDEAYTLTKKSGTGNDFGLIALEELMRYMEKYRGRLAVLVAGYPRQMRDFLKANPGLMSRFPTDNVMHFPDYAPNELQQILDRILAKDSYKLSPEALKEITQVITKLYEQRDTQFGNAREMRNLAQALVRRRATRIQRGNLPVDEPIQPEDINEEYRVYASVSSKPSDEVEAALAHINQMIGLNTVKDAVRRLVARSRVSQRLNEPIRADTLHMLFRGAPGTGKTTVAKDFGKILKGLGYLKKGHLVSVTRSDLVGEYIGQSEKKIQAELEQAKDGVLFIDEAYSLFMENVGNDFGRVVLNELTGYMDEHRDRLAVILAGYPDEIDSMLMANPGLRDRFRSPIDFPNYTQTELLHICRQMSQADGYRLTATVETRIASYLERMQTNDPECFGNARVVRVLLDEMKDRLSDRVYEKADAIVDDGEFRQLVKQFQDVDVPHPPKFKLPTDSRRRGKVLQVSTQIRSLNLHLLPPAADHLR